MLVCCRMPSCSVFAELVFPTVLSQNGTLTIPNGTQLQRWILKDGPMTGVNGHT